MNIPGRRWRRASPRVWSVSPSLYALLILLMINGMIAQRRTKLRKLRSARRKRWRLLFTLVEVLECECCSLSCVCVGLDTFFLCQYAHFHIIYYCYLLQPTYSPKGVMLSFSNLTVPTFGLINTTHCTSADRYLSYLPISHGMFVWFTCVFYSSLLNLLNSNTNMS